MSRRPENDHHLEHNRRETYRSGMERRVIGSVAERVVRHSERPVLTVRISDTDRIVTDRTAAAVINIPFKK